MTAQVESDPSLIEPQEFVTDEFRINPFPIYKRLREHEPVYQDKFQNRWISLAVRGHLGAFTRTTRGSRGLSTTRTASSSSGRTRPWGRR